MGWIYPEARAIKEVAVVVGTDGAKWVNLSKYYRYLAVKTLKTNFPYYR